MTEKQRNARGQFVQGNKCGRGNPFSRHVNRLRAALLEEVPEDRLRAIVEALMQKAETGDLGAIKILLDRVFGPPVPADILERLEALEAATDPAQAGDTIAVRERP